ncbi:MAG: site-2 protease family protein [Oscillospiraceae bacterium]|nr:site-2 protease family protein [Oscillospiraceae bacterium]
MYIILAILIFGLLILVHEFGHFIAAKLLDVQVNEFSLCMGPALWQRTWGETKYSLRLIPIGGYCAMEGEDEESANPRAFTSKPVWVRAVILVAGVFMNFLTGLLILAILLSTSAGFYSPVITEFAEGCPYEGEDALQVGDEILSVDGERVYIYSDLSLLWERNSSGVYDMVVRRNGEKVRLDDFRFVKVEYESEGETVLRYGLNFGNIIPRTFGNVLNMAWRNALDFIRLTRMGLMDLISGLVSINEMSGPVGIVSVISETGKQSETTGMAITNITYLAAFLAVDLAFMNLLPIPALDGGRLFLLLVTALIEKITRKKINPKYEGYIHAAGMVVLLGFMAFITFKDILKLFGR